VVVGTTAGTWVEVAAALVAPGAELVRAVFAGPGAASADAS
jgi:hypothetical protein